MPAQRKNGERMTAMCDKEHFEKLEERVNDLEVAQKEHCAASDVRFKEQEKTVKLLIACFKWVFGSLFLLLLIFAFAIIYGAIGERGLNAVGHAVHQVH